ncbi:MAG: ATP-binding protein [Candidatus Sulfotelmatobacter sp.]
MEKTADKTNKINKISIKNPFMPGAGHKPPYLAGREHEKKEFTKLLAQDVILKNLILTGLRGLGKTVLLEEFKPLAIQAGWLWAGTDLTESTSVSEENLAIRLLTDLSVVTSSIAITVEQRKAGFGEGNTQVSATLNFPALRSIYDSTPGLVLDKLKSVLEFVWSQIEATNRRGIIFAYDEAQNLRDYDNRDQFPLSLLLDLFQSLQRKNIRFMLALTGLPTLFPKLVKARTFSERMFTQVSLGPLNEQETSEAVLVPIKQNQCPVSFEQKSLTTIWNITRGYPYFVQYVCREVYDVWVQALGTDGNAPSIPVIEIMRKLDTDFFSGRWAQVTDRQRELLQIVAFLENADTEFTVQEIVESSANETNGHQFSGSVVNSMLLKLAKNGLVYKNRHGKYSFAVPLMSDFIKRQMSHYYGPIGATAS